MIDARKNDSNSNGFFRGQNLPEKSMEEKLWKLIQSVEEINFDTCQFFLKIQICIFSNRDYKLTISRGNFSIFRHCTVSKNFRESHPKRSKTKKPNLEFEDEKSSRITPEKIKFFDH